MSSHTQQENVTKVEEARESYYHVVCHDCEIESLEKTLGDAEYRVAIHPEGHEMSVSEVAR